MTAKKMDKKTVWNKSWDSTCVRLLNVVSNDRVHVNAAEPVKLQYWMSAFKILPVY